MNPKCVLNKIILLFFGMILFYGINETKAQTQSKAVNNASVYIINPSEIALVKCINSFSQVVPKSISVSGRSNLFLAENGKQMSKVIRNLASFSINQESNNSFSVSLPSQPIILENSKNKNTIKVDGWQSIGQPGKDEFNNDIWVVNLGASLKIISVNNKQGGAYVGTFPVSFDYN